MDNRELTDAASALIQWANSQELNATETMKVMHKVMAKIMCDRLGVKKGSPPPSQDSWTQIVLAQQEELMHELVTRIFIISGRRM